MLGSLICWGMALAILFTSAGDSANIYMRCLVAMGFIFLGIFSRAVSVYYETHKHENNENKNEKNT